MKRGSIFETDGIPRMSEALPLAMQHVVAMIVGCVTPAIIVSGAVPGGLSREDQVILIQSALVIAALATLLQLFPIGGKTKFAIGSGLAAVAALMYCATYPRVTNDMGSMMGMKAFIAAVLGGIGIIPGAMLGGILIGLIEIFVKLFAPGWYEAVTYGTLIVILLVKPSGILGKNVGEKV